MEVVPISDIFSDQETQARTGLSEETVCEYAEAMKAGDEFPALDLVFDGFAYYVADGHHRIEAAKRVGQTTVNANVTNGGLRDAVLIAVRANTSHGLRRTLDDRRKAVRMLLADEEWRQWSDAEIARTCKVSRELVAKLRTQSGAQPDTVQCTRGGKQFSTRPSRRRRELYPAETSSMPDEAFDPRDVELEELRAATALAYREKEALEDQLTATLAGGDDSAREEAASVLASLREEIRSLEIERKELTISRDMYQRENGQLKKQLDSWSKFRKKVQKRCTCGAFDD
jgi:uncharacterized ParB-like nuclease family protein